MINGISIIIVTYRRHKSLAQLLDKLVHQNTSVPWEVILINNWPKENIRKGRLDLLGRQIARVPDITIVNMSHNLGCSVRYQVHGLAKYDTLLLLDDDVEILSEGFVNGFYMALNLKRSVDIVSGWCTAFKAGRIPDYYKVDNYTFLDRGQPEVEVDLVGPGLCMFKKKILFSRLADIPSNFRDADNVWLSMMSTLLFKSRKYYVPCSDLVRFHEDYASPYAMYRKTSVDNSKRQAVKDIYKLGYIPLYARNPKR